MGAFSKELQAAVSPKFNEDVLIKIFQKKFFIKDVIITDIEFKTNSKKGDSYLSTITRFTSKATGNDERNGESRNVVLPIISKSLPINIGRRKTFRSVDFFNNEVIFYNKVWKAMNDFQHSKNSSGIFNNIPLCISALADGTNDYITLEDLSFKGYVSAARCNGLDLNHTLIVMKLFAKFHALGLAFKNQQPQKFEEVANSLQVWQVVLQGKPIVLRNFVLGTKHFKLKLCILLPMRDAIGKQLPSSYLNKLNELFASDFYGTLIRHCEARGPLSVITHGDAWIPNFLIKYDDNKIPLKATMIDFQLARYASLALDITFFLYSCTDQSLRLKYWDSLIEDYHKTFTETLEQLGSSPELLTLNALKVEIKKYALFGVGMSTEAVTMSLLEDDETADLDLIQGDEEVPLESIFIVHPYESECKRQRLADIIKHAVDNDFM